MKTVIFTEEQLNNLDVIGEKLFCDENDPRSSGYVRRLSRPKINWWRITFGILAFFVAVSLFVVVVKSFISSLFVFITAVICFCLSYIVLSLKRIIICLVKIYQRYAPDSLRNKCRFEPSCSEYMILALEKYGIVKGLKKGINRLKRCNVNGGGIDFP